MPGQVTKAEFIFLIINHNITSQILKKEKFLESEELVGEGFGGQELGSVLNKTSWGWGYGLDVRMDTWKK